MSDFDGFVLAIVINLLIAAIVWHEKRIIELEKKLKEKQNGSPSV